MTPGARVQAAIEILDRWLTGAEGADRLLAQWGRASRYAGSGDRRAVADLVYDALRRMRSAAWVAGAQAADGRAVLRGSLLLDGLDPAAFFTGDGHAPSALSEAEATPIRSLDMAPRAVRLDLDDWLMRLLAGVPDEALAPLRHRAPLHLRVNRLKVTPEQAVAELAREGVVVEPGPLDPDCLVVRENPHRVAQSIAYLEGLVEVQDAASQAAARYASAQPGQTVLDFCAGGGGKALAMAAQMGGQGAVYAHDIAAERLAQIAPRAARAGAMVSVLAPRETVTLAQRCDLVLVDAPCSGSGAWARNPDAKWRLSPERLAELQALQDQILDLAAQAVRPGGRLVYATCSLIADENQRRTEAFLTRQAGFAPGRRPLVLTPADGGGGFFACELCKAE